MAAAILSILNIAGVPNAEFIEEVTDSQLIKKNEIFFALLVDGIPGDPGFGVGISELVGNLNTDRLKDELSRRSKETLLDLVNGIEYGGIAVEQVAEQQFIGADIHFTDLDSNADIMIPLAFGNT